MSASKRLEAGLFAWQADGTVGRIYPGEGFGTLTIAPNKTVTTNKAGIRFTSAPMPGQMASEEAIIVVGCRGMVDYTQLAPSLADAALSSLSKAIETPVFLEKLVTACQSGISVRALSYRVEREGR